MSGAIARHWRRKPLLIAADGTQTATIDPLTLSLQHQQFAQTER